MSQDDRGHAPKEQQASVMDMFVHKPLLAIVVCAVLVLAGLQAISSLPVLQFPKIESSSLVITTNYTGASAEVVQGFITEPIERAAATIPGVDYVDSNTLAGLSTVTVWLKLNQNSTSALAELNTRLNQIRFELPAGAEDPSVEVSRADRSIAAFYLNVESEGLSRAAVTDYLSREVTPLMTSIAGVQRIGLEGGRNPAMRVWIDPVKMAAFDISASEVLSALRSNNIIATLGYSENSGQRINLLGDTTLQTPADFKRLILRETDDALVRLSDIATIDLGEEEGELNARFNDSVVIFISIWPLPGANEIDIGDQLYVMLDQINAGLPDGLHIGIAYDGTLYMRNALKEIIFTLVETVVLVGIVVLLLMGSFRTALVPLVTIPISILGAIAAISIMGFSLNLLTVLAIVLSVGLVVDDAIVVVENVGRHMRAGMSRSRAALVSSRQLLTPIIAMTITLAAVYAPIGFLSGLTGVLFKEFAFTLAIAVLISGVVAVTLSPIMSAWVSPQGGQEGKFTRSINDSFERLQMAYGRWLIPILSWRNPILFAGLFISLLSLPFYLFAQKELSPIEDTSEINIIVESAPEASLEYSNSHMNETVAKLMETEGASYVWQVVRPMGGFGGLILKPYDQRESSTLDILPSLYSRLTSVSGLDVFPMLLPSLPSAGQFDVELVVMANDKYANMKPYADKLVQAGLESGQFMFVDTDLKLDFPQVKFLLDRERIADLGMSLADVNEQLSVMLSGDYVNRYDADGKAYRVIPMVQDRSRLTPESLLDLQLRSPAGDLIPVSAVVKLETVVGPRQLGKFDQLKSFRIYGGILPHSTKAQALEALEAAAAEILPAGYSINYAGESRQLRSEGNTLISVLLVAIVVVYLVLAVQFNSFRDPLVVLVGSVPLALAGALVFPFFGLTTINIYSQIGLITLIGLIAKNAILVIEFAKEQQLHGLSKHDAITAAATTRLRPVLMTTAATVLGHFPLLLVEGPGAAARNSIGIILVAGMMIGTVFTLVILPCIYMLLAKEHGSNVTKAEQQGAEGHAATA